jgi:predicted O-linked N-acetylglucosamine transferase (SPINDLY family)
MNSKELPSISEEQTKFQKKIFNYCEENENEFSRLYCEEFKDKEDELFTYYNDDDIFKKLNENANSFSGLLFLINQLIVIKHVQTAYIYINYLNYIYPQVDELEHYLKILKNDYEKYFKLEKSLIDFINLEINKDKIIKDKILSFSNYNIKILQQKYQIAEKNKDKDEMITLGLFAIKKFGINYGNQLCIIYIMQGKLREALQILLYLTYEKPLDKQVLAHWGKLSIALASQKSYWIMRLGYILFPNELTLLINYTGSNDVTFKEKIDVFDRIFKISPKEPSALINYSNFLAFQGKTKEAIDNLYIAKENSKTFNQVVESNILFLSQYSSSVNYNELTKKHIDYSNNVINAGIKLKALLLQPVKTNKIKIGFVSPDLINHPISYYMFNLIKYLPRDKFDLYIFYTLQRKDLVTNIFMNMVAEKWIDISREDAKSSRDIIIKNNIEVLVDCSGHTAGGRLELFYNRSAPVQCTYLGYPYTTGVKNIDFKFSDQSFANQQDYFTEKIVNIDKSSICFQPLVARLDMVNDSKYAVQCTPALRNKYITFGISTNPSKLNDVVIKVFSKILLSISNSKLLIEATGLNDLSFKAFIIERFSFYGINSEQLILLPRDTRMQYLIYNEIDIALDPFPYNGGTSSLDLLWMGLPLITLRGTVGMSMEGTALMQKLNKKNLIAETQDDYVRIACELASNISNLNSERLMQREILSNSSLMNGPDFGINFGNAIIKIHR